MENIVTIRTFIQQLSHYIKLCTYVNKGTDLDNVLEKCIKIHNKYKTIEFSTKFSQEDEVVVRRCLKRLNLVLKIDNNNNPIDIKNKENQLKMIYFQEHPSLAQNDIESFMSFAVKHNIHILTDLPLTFVLREGKYQELLWHYTRSLFYMSQCIITETNNSTVCADEKSVMKKKIYDLSLERLETVLEIIGDIETRSEINNTLKLDKFLNNKLLKTGITTENVGEARQEVKEMFTKKGLGDNKPVMGIIDSIASRLFDVDISSGNIVQSMISIAGDVAQEVKGDLERDPDSFQNAIGAITDMFKENMGDPEKNKDIPDEFKSVFSAFTSMTSGDPDQNNDENATEILDTFIKNNGIDKNDFYSNIMGEDGNIDHGRLDNFMQNIGSQKYLA